MPSTIIARVDLQDIAEESGVPENAPYQVIFAHIQRTMHRHVQGIVKLSINVRSYYQPVAHGAAAAKPSSKVRTMHVVKRIADVNSQAGQMYDTVVVIEDPRAAGRSTRKASQEKALTPPQMLSGAADSAVDGQQSSDPSHFRETAVAVPPAFDPLLLNVLSVAPSGSNASNPPILGPSRWVPRPTNVLLDGCIIRIGSQAMAMGGAAVSPSTTGDGALGETDWLIRLTTVAMRGSPARSWVVVEIDCLFNDLPAGSPFLQSALRSVIPSNSTARPNIPLWEDLADLSFDGRLEAEPLSASRLAGSDRRHCVALVHLLRREALI